MHHSVWFGSFSQCSHFTRAERQNQTSNLHYSVL